MNTLHIVGRKNHGKTTLVVALLAELTGRGLRVGSIKHTSHLYDLDAPGTDSYRHRQAGAAPAAIVTGALIGVVFPRDPEADFYRRLEPLYAECDLVLVEGHLDHPGPKIEVWRGSLGMAPLAAEHRGILAVVTDDPLALAVPIWPRADVPALANRTLAIARGCAGGATPYRDLPAAGASGSTSSKTRT